jgi:hypothetical protein
MSDPNKIKSLFNMPLQPIESPVKSEVTSQSSEFIPVKPLIIPEGDIHFDDPSFDFLKASLPPDHLFNTLSSREIAMRFEAAGEEFQKLYPSFHDFMNKKLLELTNPYKNMIQDLIEKELKAESDDKPKAHTSEVAFGTIMVVNDMVQEMLFRSMGPGALTPILESLNIHKKINQVFSENDDTTDELSVVLGLLAACTERLAHMIAHVQIEKLAGLHDGL